MLLREILDLIGGAIIVIKSESEAEELIDFVSSLCSDDDGDNSDPYFSPRPPSFLCCRCNTRDTFLSCFEDMVRHSRVMEYDGGDDFAIRISSYSTCHPMFVSSGYNYAGVYVGNGNVSFYENLLHYNTSTPITNYIKKDLFCCSLAHFIGVMKEKIDEMGETIHGFTNDKLPSETISSATNAEVFEFIQTDY